jgi:hypothetical protein
MVGGVEIEIWIFAQALMAQPNAGRQEAGSLKEGFWGTPMDVGERVEKVDVDWLGLG